MDSIVEVAEGLGGAGRSIFLGWNPNDPSGKPEFAWAEDHVSVLGPPRSGKSSAIFVPSIASHPGPVVVTSVRVAGKYPDLRDVTFRARSEIAAAHGGIVAELAIDDAITPRGEPVSWDITIGCQAWNVALDRARSLAGAAIPLSSDNALAWRNSVVNLLAPLIHAAALGQIDQIEMLTWARFGDEEPSIGGVRRYLSELHSETHPSVRACDIILNSTTEVQQNVLYVLNADVLGAFSFEIPDNVALLDIPRLLSGWSTLYITLRPEREESTRALIAGLIGAIFSEWQRSSDSRAVGTLLLALDEVANVAPVAMLPEIVATGGGAGVQCLLGFQSPAQASRCWGEEGIETIIRGTRHTVIFPGLDARLFLEETSSLFGKMTRYHPEIHVTPGAPIGPATADAELLIREREYIERHLQMVGTDGAARARLEKRVGRALAMNRRRARLRYMSLPEDEERSSEHVLQEVRRYTQLVRAAERRESVEAAEIFRGLIGSVFLKSFERGTGQPVFSFNEIEGWWRDPVWSRLLGG